MVDSKLLLGDLQKLVKRLHTDLRARAGEDAALDAHLKAEYEKAKKAGRTALAYAAWRDEPLIQAAVAWVLGAVFVRFLEDNGLLDLAREPRRFLAGGTKELRELAEAHYLDHIRAHPEHADDAFLLSVFTEVGRLPGGAFLFDAKHNPVFKVALSPDGAKELRLFFRKQDPATGGLLHDFADPAWETRFLGDLYQDLSEEAKKRYALLQTPDFVEEFILDRTLTPAIEEFGWEAVRLVDPACGSGHFLLGAFGRLADLRAAYEPALPRPEIARRALEQVYGVDLNPFAAAIARFRLLIAALRVAGLTRLEQAPAFAIHVAAGDSLLHGRVHRRKTADVQPGLMPELSMHDHYYETEDAEQVARILGGRYHAVVANPPYITVKDAGLNELIRDRFDTCKGKYSLVCPFMERLVDLCVQPRAAAAGVGYVGVIASNAFMKREFGSKLVEEFLPRWDLTHVIDTSGAYIPGHGTPTVILFARGQRPQLATVRAVMGIRGEPSPPEDAAKGIVWRAIVEQVDAPGSQSEFVSVAEVERERLAKHPWSMGGGGAAELKATIDEATDTRLGSLVEAIGITAVTGEDDLYIVGTATTASRNSLERSRGLVVGDNVRDWTVAEPARAAWTYDPDLKLASLDSIPGISRLLWKAKTWLSRRKRFGTPMLQRGLTWFEWQELYTDKLRTPLSITFAFVATHNHFVLDRGGRVFKQTAPVIKLPPTATEDDHLGLLGLLNSSTACFWMKQVFYPKATAAGDISTEAGRPENNRYEFAGTGLLEFPVPATSPSMVSIKQIARTIDSLATELSDAQPKAIVGRWGSSRSAFELESALKSAESLDAKLRGQLIALQEELDWECYSAYGLSSERADVAVLALMPEVAGTARPFAWSDDRAPETLDERLRATYERRRNLIRQNSDLQLIETAVHKRLWLGPQGVFGHSTRDYQGRVRDALRDWLCDRLERPDAWPEEDGTPSLQTTTRLSDRVRSDPDFRRAAELYTKRSDVSYEMLVKDLCIGEGVPYLAALRYTDEGLRKRALWEDTWDLQRREDRGETGLDIPVPPKYDSKDFKKSSYWRQRGKLDVPKERFVLYPGAEREADPAPVVGWAGWDHLQRARALAAYYVRLKDELGLESIDTPRLVPLLAGLQELVPWLLQWHDEPLPDLGEGMGTYLRKFVASEARLLGVTVEGLGAWRPEKVTRGRRANPSKSRA